MAVLPDHQEAELAVLLDAYHPEQFTLYVSRQTFAVWRRLARYRIVSWRECWGFSANDYSFSTDHTHTISVWYCTEQHDCRCAGRIKCSDWKK